MYDRGFGSWTGNFSVPTLSNAPVWWYLKLPTDSTASVQFDP
jgi:hypothetical protein